MPPTTLVIVCCHAIYLGGEHHRQSPPPPSSRTSNDANEQVDIQQSKHQHKDPHEESSWLLAPFQSSTPTKEAEHHTFLRHLRIGLDHLSPDILLSPPPPSFSSSSNNKNKNTILILSGGPTKLPLTTLSESTSYLHAALSDTSTSTNYSTLASRALEQGQLLLEQHATDSYQNLLFSLLLYRRSTGAYPRKVRIVTHAFKARRFLELHAKALRWPAGRIEVLGVDPVMGLSDLTDTTQNEYARGYLPWKEDPHGERPPLSTKRVERGWSEEQRAALLEGLDGLEDSVRELVMFGREPAGRLPWEEEDEDEDEEEER